MNNQQDKPPQDEQDKQQQTSLYGLRIMSYTILQLPSSLSSLLYLSSSLSSLSQQHNSYCQVHSLKVSSGSAICQQPKQQ